MRTDRMHKRAERALGLSPYSFNDEIHKMIEAYRKGAIISPNVIRRAMGLPAAPGES